ncbi:MAG: nickel-dependent lactate racemase, partial [Clostridiales bacterium]|nr:nickel-dependent lactate racemase [Clostridiales bacterium]
MFPKFVMIKQNYKAEKLDDLGAEIRNTIAKSGYDMKELDGKTVGIAVGSRGISNISTIVREIVSTVKEAGGKPIVFAAMGSHGNGTAEGQREMLASLGVTEENIGTDIRTCADGVYYGTTDNGLDVYGNPLAMEFDKVILVNRIKPHTDFEDITESGIFKLMAIGIGNPKGADAVHFNALTLGYGEAIRSAGGLILKKLPVAFAIAITENWKHETNSLTAILPENLLEMESKILAQIKEGMVRLPADKFDTLIVNEAGKDISGTCVDTKVVGRIMIAGQAEPEKPKIRTIAVLDFTDASHGNSMGLGVVDVITRRVFDKINIDATSLTGITSKCLLQAKIPCVAKNDSEAIAAAFMGSGVKDNIKAAIIKNTNALEYVAVSEALYEEIKDKKPLRKLESPLSL